MLSRHERLSPVVQDSFFFLFPHSRKHDVVVEYVVYTSRGVHDLYVTNIDIRYTHTRDKVTRVWTGDRRSTWKLEFPIICERCERFRLSARRKQVGGINFGKEISGGNLLSR